MNTRSNSNAAALHKSPLALTPFEERLFADLPEGEVAQALRERGLPSRRTETWRWSDLRAAERTPRAASVAFASDEGSSPITVDGATVLTLKNGRPQAPQGVEPKPIVKSGEKIGSTYVVADGLVLSFYNQGRTKDEIGRVGRGLELAALAATGPLVSISILPGFAHKLLLRRFSDGEGQHQDNVFVTLGEGAQGTLIETHEVTGSPFINSRTEIELDAQSSLDRVIVQEASPDAVVIHSSLLRFDEKLGDEIVALNQVTLALGAKLARHETRVNHLGESKAQIDALYRLKDNLHTDITTHITFSGEDAQTDQLIKGIAGDRSRGVFQGKFLVERGAQRTDAQMAHHALLLSKGAQVNAKPELEIYADDVECAHGNTAGALDPEALFYMRQRGVPEGEARALLIEAFAGEVLGRVPDEAIRSQLEEILRRAG
ncbi:MAG: Fe-S cluster assembly protein SufD [Pseudomonadota bacterium]